MRVPAPYGRKKMLSGPAPRLFRKRRRLPSGTNSVPPPTRAPDLDRRLRRTTAQESLIARPLRSSGGGSNTRCGGRSVTRWRWSRRMGPSGRGLGRTDDLARMSWFVSVSPSQAKQSGWPSCEKLADERSWPRRDLAVWCSHQQCADQVWRKHRRADCSPIALRSRAPSTHLPRRHPSARRRPA